MVAMVLMTTSVSAQRIDGVYMVARVLTDKMAEELGLSNVQREKAYQTNLYYLNGINGYRDINSQTWRQRNSQLKNILTTSQWKSYKRSSYFYRPISWRGDSYVYNFYSKYSDERPSFGGNRGNMAVTLPAPSRGQRPVEVGRPQQPNNMPFNGNQGKPNGSYNKKNNGKSNDRKGGSYNDNGSSNRSFGSMRR